MLQESANEFATVKTHLSFYPVSPVIFVIKTNLTMRIIFDAMIGNGYSVSVVTQVMDQGIRRVEGFFGVYHPVFAVALLFQLIGISGCNHLQLTSCKQN